MSHDLVFFSPNCMAYVITIQLSIMKTTQLKDQLKNRRNEPRKASPRRHRRRSAAGMRRKRASHLAARDPRPPARSAMSACFFLVAVLVMLVASARHRLLAVFFLRGRPLAAAVAPTEDGTAEQSNAYAQAGRDEAEDEHLHDPHRTFTLRVK